jgi:hypothetical protein
MTHPYNLKEMLARQKAERDKKDYEEMLKRGEEALRSREGTRELVRAKQGIFVRRQGSIGVT